MPVNSLPETDFYSLTVSGDTIIAGSANRVYISKDAGNSWIESSIVDMAAAGVEAALYYHGDLYVGSYGTGAFRSTNDGQSWEALNQGLVGSGALFISSLVANGNKLVCGTYGAGMFVLEPLSGSRWQPLHQNYPLSIAGTVRQLIMQDNDLLAAAGANGLVYRFPAATVNWSSSPLIPPLVAGLSVTDFIEVGNWLYAGVVDVDLRDFYDPVFRSNDKGLTWVPAGTNLVRNGDKITFTTHNGTLFLALHRLNSFRLYHSEDGVNWQLQEENFVFLYDLAVCRDRLFSARTNGLWVVNLPLAELDEPVPQQPLHFTLQQNYPNPFNPQTTIQFDLPAASVATLQIFNNLGQLVETPYKASLPSGNHKFTWNATDAAGNPVASGVYFYRLNAGEFSQTRRMLLLR